MNISKGKCGFLDLTDMKFGKLTALYHFTKNKVTFWHCMCDCGREKDVTSFNLVHERSISCGCSKRKYDYNIEIGSMYSKLTFIEKIDEYKGLFKCSCGNSIKFPFCDILSGRRKSCGRCKKEQNSCPICGVSYGAIEKCKAMNLCLDCYHIYRVIMIMHQRCYNKKAVDYHSYGGRGITICDEWYRNYTAFIKWTLNSSNYEKGLTIDRIDVNKGYSSDNCKWSTLEVQAQNRTNNVLNKDLVLKIRKMLSEGIKRKVIAKEINTTEQYIGQIARNEIWKNYQL